MVLNTKMLLSLSLICCVITLVRGEPIKIIEPVYNCTSLAQDNCDGPCTSFFARHPYFINSTYTMRGENHPNSTSMYEDIQLNSTYVNEQLFALNLSLPYAEKPYVDPNDYWFDYEYYDVNRTTPTNNTAARAYKCNYFTNILAHDIAVNGTGYISDIILDPDDIEARWPGKNITQISLFVTFNTEITTNLLAALHDYMYPPFVPGLYLIMNETSPGLYDVQMIGGLSGLLVATTADGTMLTVPRCYERKCEQDNFPKLIYYFVDMIIHNVTRDMINNDADFVTHALKFDQGTFFRDNEYNGTYEDYGTIVTSTCGSLKYFVGIVVDPDPPGQNKCEGPGGGSNKTSCSRSQSKMSPSRSRSKSRRSRSRSKSVRSRSRSRSRRSQSRSRSKSIRSRSRSKSVRSRSRSKSKQSRSRSKSARSQSRSKSIRSRSRSKSVQSRSRSTSIESKSRSKSARSRSRSKSVQSRSRSNSANSRSRSKSGKSQSRSKSGKSKSQSKSKSKSKSSSQSQSSSNSNSNSGSQSESNSHSASNSRSSSKSMTRSDSQSNSKSESNSNSDSNSISNSRSKSNSQSESNSRSTSNSRSSSNSMTHSDSQSKSKSESNSNSNSVSQSESNSRSMSTSRSMSNSRSGSNSMTHSDSKSMSNSNSNSDSQSESNSHSMSDSRSNSNYTGQPNNQTSSKTMSDSGSQSQSGSNSRSMSTSKSSSNSMTDSDSQSMSTSNSKSTSQSDSQSESESKSKSQSQSASDSQSSSNSNSDSRSKSIQSQSHSKSMQSQSRSKQSKSVRSRTRSNQSQSRSKSGHSQSHSESINSRSRSKSLQSRSRSKSVQSRTRSNNSRSRSKSLQSWSRSHSKSLQSQSHSKSIQSRSPSISKQSRSRSKSMSRERIYTRFFTKTSFSYFTIPLNTPAYEGNNTGITMRMGDGIDDTGMLGALPTVYTFFSKGVSKGIINYHTDGQYGTPKRTELYNSTVCHHFFRFVVYPCFSACPARFTHRVLNETAFSAVQFMKGENVSRVVDDASKDTDAFVLTYLNSTYVDFDGDLVPVSQFLNASSGNFFGGFVFGVSFNGTWNDVDAQKYIAVLPTTTNTSKLYISMRLSFNRIRFNGTANGLLFAMDNEYPYNTTSQPGKLWPAVAFSMYIDDFLLYPVVRNVSSSTIDLDTTRVACDKYNPFDIYHCQKYKTVHSFIDMNVSFNMSLGHFFKMEGIVPPSGAHPYIRTTADYGMDSADENLDVTPKFGRALWRLEPCLTFIDDAVLPVPIPEEGNENTDNSGIYIFVASLVSLLAVMCCCFVVIFAITRRRKRRTSTENARGDKKTS